MNTNNIGNWLTLIANLSVVVGIVFLIQEISQANRIARNEAEQTIGIASLDLSSTAKSSSSLLAKLFDEGSSLTIEESIEAEFLAFEFVNVYGLVNTAYRNGLITDYLFEIYMKDMNANIDKYPGLAAVFAEIYTTRWADLREGESAFVDRLRGTLVEKGLINQ